MDEPIPDSPTKNGRKASGEDSIATWTYCENCKKVVTPLTFLSEQSWKFSFGKFLEVYFYNKTAQLHSLEHRCSCNMQEASTLYFGSGHLAARFVYEKIRPWGVYLRRHLPFDEIVHEKFAVNELNEIMVSSADLFEKFHQQIEDISKETKHLFGSPANKPEHLQTLLSQLNEIDSEVTTASVVLKAKIVSVTTQYNEYKKEKGSQYVDNVRSSIYETFAYFPWQARRYFFTLASAWNERLSSMGQALDAMKKLSEASLKAGSVVRSDIGIVQTTIPDSDFEDVKDAMKRLKQLREYYGANLNIDEINANSLSTYSGQKKVPNDDLEYQEDLEADAPYRDTVDYNFAEEVDADVLASRQRYNQHGDVQQQQQQKKSDRRSPSTSKSNGNSQRIKPPRLHSSSHGRLSQIESSHTPIRSRSQSPSQINVTKSVTAGGAVKSALTRLFNRPNIQHDPYVVDLGALGLGRPKMEAGVGGIVIPVFDEQPSTIIAHSLASADYASQFKRYAKAEMRGSDDRRRSKNDRDSPSMEDYFSGSNGLDASQHFKKAVEKRMLGRNKTHVKHSFRDYDEKATHIAKFQCTTFWATQFQAVRQAFLKESSNDDGQTVSYNNSTFATNAIEENYVKSLSASLIWAVSGGKSGASFSKTSDERFIVKCISRTELQMVRKHLLLYTHFIFISKQHLFCFIVPRLCTCLF